MLKLFLLGEKGYTCLTQLKPHHLKKVGTVVIGRDPNIEDDFSGKIQDWCVQHSVNGIFRRDDTDQNQDYDALVAIGWRWIIDSADQLIVFHDSLLPKYRGFNPLVSALLNRDAEIGVTALMGVEEFDKGPIVGQASMNVKYRVKLQEVVSRISDLYADLLNRVLDDLYAGTLKEVPQNESEASYSLWRDDEDYRIDWNKSAEDIALLIDSVGPPYKGASTTVNGNLLRIFDAEVLQDVTIENRVPGKVLFKNKDSYTIVCGTGLLQVSQFINDQGEPEKLDKFRLRFK